MREKNQEIEDFLKMISHELINNLDNKDLIGDMGENSNNSLI